MRILTMVFEVTDEAAFEAAFCAEQGPEALLARLGLRRIAVASGDCLTVESFRAGVSLDPS
jgi:hypothetical protein